MDEIASQRTLTGGAAAGPVGGANRVKAVGEALRKNVVVLTGCRVDQTAADATLDHGKNMGAATWAMHQVLEMII